MRIPQDAFAYYVSLGPERSYELVAKHFGVSKRGIVKVGSRDHWMERLAKIEQAARERNDEKLVSEAEARHARQGKMVRAMAGRVAQGLQTHALSSGMEAIKAAEIVIKLERLLAGQPSERTEVAVQQTIKQEMDRLLATPGEVDDEEDW